MLTLLRNTVEYIRTRVTLLDYTCLRFNQYTTSISSVLSEQMAHLVTVLYNTPISETQSQLLALWTPTHCNITISMFLSLSLFYSQHAAAMSAWLVTTFTSSLTSNTYSPPEERETAISSGLPGFHCSPHTPTPERGGRG